MTIGMMQERMGFTRRQIAKTSASVTSWAVLLAFVDQPTTRRENRSMTAATYSQPSAGPEWGKKRRCASPLPHFQRQLQLAFQKRPALLTDFLCLSSGSFYDHDKVVSVSAIGSSLFPLPFPANRGGAALLDAGVPCPSVLPGIVAQVFRPQPHIKLVEHDVGQER